ncbi:MAG: DUF3530 family protein [Burkholderiales bacterium]|nr:DUF3530 family protein [Burkholderiales bacterium]
MTANARRTPGCARASSAQPTRTRSARRVRTLALALAFIAPAACAIDYARERRWAQEIEPAILVGDPVYLALASGQKFLALYTSPAQPRGAAILVHGAGVHPDWGLIGTLRSRLPDLGYATLSVQMPVLAAEAPREAYAETFPQAAERLRQALAFLRQRGHARIAIVAHSMGARMANYFLTSARDRALASWVSIGVSEGEFVGLEAAGIATLDLYGERDLPAVLAGAERRAAILQRLPKSSQVVVSGADHFFRDHEDALLAWIKRFLDRTLPL